MVQDENSVIEEVKEDVIETVTEDVWGGIKEFLNQGFHFGEGDKAIHLTIGLVLMLVLALLFTSYFLKWIRQFLTRKMEGEDKLKFVNVFRFIKYVVFLAVLLFTMNAAGIDITLLITASAVLFVGLGLALQDLFQDIIGGIYIIIDKSVTVGDIIEVNNKVGKIIEIELRSTRALTRDDKVFVIPNHKFMSDIVYNYTQNHKTTREFVAVGVAYGSDVELVTKLLLKSVSKDPKVAKEPAPFVLFDEFGDSALLFSVHFYTKDSFRTMLTKSRIRYKIDELFRQNNITIPFPQRDVHIFHDPSSQQQNTGGDMKTIS